MNSIFYFILFSCILFSLASLTQCNLRFICVAAQINKSLLFYCWVAFHCIDKPQFIYLLTSWRTFFFFSPFFDFCKIRVATNLDIQGLLWMYNVLGRRMARLIWQVYAYLSKKVTNYFPRWRGVPFYIPMCSIWWFQSLHIFPNTWSLFNFSHYLVTMV